MVFEKLKFWKKKTFHIGETEIIVGDQSNLPKEIKKVYFNKLNKILVAALQSSKEIGHLNRLYIYYKDNYSNSSNLRKWLYKTYLAKDSTSSKVSFASIMGLSGLASVNTGQEISKGVISMNFFVDSCLLSVFRRPFDNASILEEVKLSNEEVARMGATLIRILNKNDLSSFYTQLLGVIRHEVMHLVHHNNSKNLKLNRDRALGRLKDLEKALLRSTRDYKKRDLFEAYANLRYGMENFSYGLLFEGLAEYARKEPIKKVEDWRGTYNHLKISLEVLKKQIDSIFNLEEYDKRDDESKEEFFETEMQFLYKEFYKLMYTLGFHMVYTISFYPINIFKLNRKSFFSLYEQICSEKFNERPLASYGTGKGYLDIKHTILELNFTRKKFE